jgi:hypothetical protein
MPVEPDSDLRGDIRQQESFIHRFLHNIGKFWLLDVHMQCEMRLTWDDFASAAGTLRYIYVNIKHT